MTAADLSPDNLAILEAKLRADLEMVQKVRALMQEHLGGGAPAPAVPAAIPAPAPIAPPVESPPAAAKGPVTPVHMPYTPPKDVKTEVRAVVGDLKGRFKIGAVKSGLVARYVSFADTSVRSVLMRMIQAGELKVVERGYGRGGSTFQKVGEEESAVDSDNSATV